MAGRRGRDRMGLLPQGPPSRRKLGDAPTPLQPHRMPAGVLPNPGPAPAPGQEAEAGSSVCPWMFSLSSQQLCVERGLRGGLEQVHSFPAAGHSPTGTSTLQPSPHHLTSKPKVVSALNKVSLDRKFGRKKRLSPPRCLGRGHVGFFPALHVLRGDCGKDTVPSLGSRRC